MPQSLRARLRRYPQGRERREKEISDHATILDPTQLRAVQYHRSAHIIYANKASVRLYLCVSVYVTSVVHQFKLVQITISSDNYETRKSEWSNYRHVSCGRDWSEFVILLV